MITLKNKNSISSFSKRGFKNRNIENFFLYTEEVWNGEEEAKKNIVNRKQIKMIETNMLTILIYRKELNSHNKRQIIRLDLKNSSVCCL